MNIPLPDEFVELVARRAAEIVAQLDHRPAEQWPAAMNIETAARYTDSSPERLRKLIAQRRIPFVQEAPGCAIRFLRADLDAYMLGHRREALLPRRSNSGASALRIGALRGRLIASP